MTFRGKTALITGASRGIGRACALELGRAGIKVGINYRTHPEEAAQVAEAVQQAGGQAILLQADVAEQAQVEDMVARVVSEWGRLDYYVSNAAYSDRQLMAEAEMQEFRRTVDVSMWGAFFGVRTAARQMIQQGDGGAITVVSSPHAVLAIPTAMAYNMSKAAIDHMSRTAALELAPHQIRVNIVHPGWIDTPGERKFFSEEQIEEGGKKLPLGRLGKPEEVANAIAYTLSDEAVYMTGSTLTIDGGVSLPWWSKRGEGKM